MTLRAALAGLLLLISGPVLAQGSPARCAVDPRFLGCYKQSTSFDRSNVVLMSQGDLLQTATVASILSRMIANDVSAALGFMPYSAANPAGYITQAGAPVQSVAGRSGNVALSVADVPGAAPIANPAFRGFASTSVNVNLMATGTSQATAAQITANNVFVNDGPSGSGVRLPAVSSLASGGATLVTAFNFSANPITLYPAGTDALLLARVNSPSMPIPSGIEVRCWWPGLGTAWVCSAQGTAAGGGASTGDTVATGPITSSTVFLQSPTIPTSDTLPTIAGAVPGGGLVLASGSTQAFSVKFSSTDATANVKDTQSVYDRFWTSYLVGDQTNTFEIVNATAHPGDNQKFLSRARHTSATDPARRHVVRPEGLALLANCSNSGANCTDGNIFGGMIRLPYVFRPGTGNNDGVVLKVRARGPKGQRGWTPIWLPSGEQLRPTDGSGNPYNGVIRFGGANNHEIDINDWFWTVFGKLRGLVFNTPDEYGMAWNVAPHATFAANSNGFAYNGKNPLSAMTDMDCSAEFCNFLMNWQKDTIEVYVSSDSHPNYRLAVRWYYEYNQHATTYTDAQGNTKILGMHLIVGNQAVPNFVDGWQSAVDNDGVADAWTIVVPEITAWQGSLTADSIAAATVSTSAVSPDFAFTPGSTATSLGGAAFVWWNQGNATVASNAAGPLLTQPAHQAENVAALATPLASSGVITLRAKLTGSSDNYLNGGVGLFATGSGAATILMDLPGIKQWSGFLIPSPTSSRTSTLFQEDGSAKAVAGSDYCWRFYPSGGRLNVLFSSTCNENDFQAVISPLLADIGNPTHVGFYVNSNTGGSNAAQVQMRGFSAVSGSNTQAAGP